MSRLSSNSDKIKIRFLVDDELREMVEENPKAKIFF